MPLYYASCAAGLEALASRIARSAVGHYQEERLFSGGLIFTTNHPKPLLGCFQNVYRSLARYDGVKTLEEAARRAIQDKGMQRMADRAMQEYGFSTFRVMFSQRNTLSPVDASLRIALEKPIHSAAVNRERPETELLILLRSEGFALALLRLTMGNAAQETVTKGELSPALAYCMASLGKYGAGGVFLDPFAGRGALGWARQRLGGAKKILLMDKDPDMIRAMNQRAKGKNGIKPEILQGDALELDKQLPPNSVDEIVCDPPWGLYQPLPMPAEAFYGRMLEQFQRVITPEGRLLVLTGDKAKFEQALGESGFDLAERFDLLVSGKKAALFLARRRA